MMKKQQRTGSDDNAESSGKTEAGQPLTQESGNAS